MSKGKEFPPRMELEKNKDGIVEAVSLSFVFRPFPNKAIEYLSLAESNSLCEEARREGRAEAYRYIALQFERLANLAEDEKDAKVYRIHAGWAREKASEGASDE